MDKTRFVEQVEAALNVPEGSIQQDTRLQAMQEWDSMGILTLIAVIDKNYDVNLDPSILAKCETIHDLARFVEDNCQSQ